MNSTTPTTRCSISRWLAGLLLVPLAVAAVPTPALRPPARFCGPPGRPLAALSLGPTASLFLPLVGARLTWAARVEKDCGSPALRAVGLEENSAHDELEQLLKASDSSHPAASEAWARASHIGAPAAPTSQPSAAAINNLVKGLVVKSVGPYEAKDASWVVSVTARSTNPGFTMPDITFSVTPLTPTAHPVAGLTVMLLDAQTGQALQAESLDEIGTAHFQYVRPGPSATRQSPFGTYRFEILATGLEEQSRQDARGLSWGVIWSWVHDELKSPPVISWTDYDAKEKDVPSPDGAREAMRAAGYQMEANHYGPGQAAWVKQAAGLEEGGRQATVEMATVSHPVRVFYDRRLPRPEMMGVDALALPDDPAEAVAALRVHDIQPGEPILLPNTVANPRSWRVSDVKSPILLVPANLPPQLTVQRLAALAAIASGLEEGILRITPESWSARIEGDDVFSIMY